MGRGSSDGRGRDRGGLLRVQHSGVGGASTSDRGGGSAEALQERFLEEGGDTVDVRTEPDRTSTVACGRMAASSPAAPHRLLRRRQKRPNTQLSPARTSFQEISHSLENRGIPLLGQRRHGFCRPGAILFEVLDDSLV